MNFPFTAQDAFGANEKFRELIRETQSRARSFIYPLFVGPGRDTAQPVASMPGSLPSGRWIEPSVNVTRSRRLVFRR